MERHRSPENRVNTGTERFWEAERIGRIINMLPEEGSLTIKRIHRRWEVDCRIDGCLILNAKSHDPGTHLRYIEDLLKILKGFSKDE